MHSQDSPLTAAPITKIPNPRKSKRTKNYPHQSHPLERRPYVMNCVFAVVVGAILLKTALCLPRPLFRLLSLERSFVPLALLKKIRFPIDLTLILVAFPIIIIRPDWVAPDTVPAVSSRLSYRVARLGRAQVLSCHGARLNHIPDAEPVQDSELS